MSELDRFTPAGGYILIFGLSRGGTNLCAQRLHGLQRVLSLSETVSRLIQPGETEEHRGIEVRMIREGTLLPPKEPTEQIRFVTLNKINYALRCHPVHWVNRIVAGNNTRGLLLFRNPFEIHASRCNWVRRFKPQRVRWMQIDQLARDWLEQCRIALELMGTGRARVIIHERTAEHPERLRNQLEQLCGEEFVDEQASIPQACSRCNGSLERTSRYDWDPNLWLYCPNCALFQEGFGGYNFIREASLEKFAAWSEKIDVQSLIPRFRPWLGESVLNFYLTNQHLKDGAEERLGELILEERARHAQTPLDDILYPY